MKFVSFILTLNFIKTTDFDRVLKLFFKCAAGAAGYDPTLGRPNLRSWLYRVRRDLSPHYDEITGPLKQLIKGQLVSKFQK